MTEDAALCDQAKVEALIHEAGRAAAGLGCNVLECSQAFRALFVSANALMAGAAKSSADELLKSLEEEKE